MPNYKLQNILLINDNYLAEYSELPTNYNYEELHPMVYAAQKIWIEPVIGTALYDELLEEIQSGDISSENQTLLLAMYPYLAKAVTYEALPFITYHLNEVSITKGKSENSETIDTKELNYLEQRIRSQLEYFKKDFIRWMNEHIGSFPLYYPSDCDCSCSCNGNIKLKKPNPMLQIYSPKRRCNQLR